jgi:hypothetical protein
MIKLMLRRARVSFLCRSIFTPRFIWNVIEQDHEYVVVLFALIVLNGGEVGDGPVEGVASLPGRVHCGLGFVDTC